MDFARPILALVMVVTVYLFTWPDTGSGLSAAEPAKRGTMGLHDPYRRLFMLNINYFPPMGSVSPVLGHFGNYRRRATCTLLVHLHLSALARRLDLLRNRNGSDCVDGLRPWR